MSEAPPGPDSRRQGWRGDWRGDLLRIAGVVSVVVLLLVLTYYGQYFLKFLGPECLLLAETLLAIGLHWHRQTATESTPRDGESHKAMPKRRTYRDVENRLHR